jgi:hypothetical protein
VNAGAPSALETCGTLLPGLTHPGPPRIHLQRPAESTWSALDDPARVGEPLAGQRGWPQVSRLLTDRRGWLADAATPASLTGVAATAVLGGRIASLGWTGVAWLLLAVSGLLWLVLLPLVLWHWQVPTVGASFLTCVATEGLAVLAATQGAVAGSRSAVAVGFATFVLGLILYVLVLARLHSHQLLVGAGDQWVVAGALTITNLAGAQLVLAGDRLRLLGAVREPLRVLLRRRPGRAPRASGRAGPCPVVAGPGGLGTHPDRGDEAAAAAHTSAPLTT